MMGIAAQDCCSRSKRLLTMAVLVILSGSLLAYFVQTAGGIRILDLRFAGTGGTPMSALLYIPANATPKTPAPGILAVHGYFNSRETQDGFAIEFARRGYVVLALDQTGHGYSAPPAFANHFGGPDGLAFLRNLDFVDKDNIGLEGHSMGGWAVVNAAAAFPNGYKAVVLEGSSTGAPLAPDGTTTFPRNLAVVFSTLDEFSQVMWGAATAADVPKSNKLMHVFGTESPIEPGQLYGSLQAGTGRVLYTPVGTHPMDHISPAAIGDSLKWFARTLSGGTPRPAGDQIWYWKEAGTLIALAGFVMLILGTFGVLAALPSFAPMRVIPTGIPNTRNGHWWLLFVATASIPAITLLPSFQLGSKLLPANHLMPQAFTNEVIGWALVNGILATASLLLGKTPISLKLNAQVRRSMLAAVLTVMVGYLAVALADFFFKVDFRFWFISLKLMSLAQARAFAVYLIPFTLYFLVSLGVVHRRLTVRSDTALRQYLTHIAVLTAGVLGFLIIEYGSLVTSHHLVVFFANDPLRVIVSINFIPVLCAVGVISTFAYRFTNSHLPGAFICGMLVTWYVVVGQATQVA